MTDKILQDIHADESRRKEMIKGMRKEHKQGKVGKAIAKALNKMKC